MQPSSAVSVQPDPDFMSLAGNKLFYVAAAVKVPQDKLNTEEGKKAYHHWIAQGNASPRTPEGKHAYRQWKVENGILKWLQILPFCRFQRLEKISSTAPSFYEKELPEWFKPFQVNGHSYSALGTYAGDTLKAQMNNYIYYMLHFDLVINLIEEYGQTTPYFLYTENPYFQQHYKVESRGTDKDIYRFGQRILYHFKKWCDGEKIEDQDISNIIELAKLVVDAQSENKKVFVHCLAGKGRTTLFIALCELVHKKDEIKRSNNDRVRFLIDDSLKQMARTLWRRRPNQTQLGQFYSDAFINKVRPLL